MFNDMNAVLPQDTEKKPDYRGLDPWMIIVESARAMGIKLNRPKENCKHCHGRGYIGRHADSGEPIACNCIFPKETYDREIGNVQYRPMNRAERRAQMKKQSKKVSYNPSEETNICVEEDRE